MLHTSSSTSPSFTSVTISRDISSPSQKALPSPSSVATAVPVPMLDTFPFAKVKVSSNKAGWWGEDQTSDSPLLSDFCSFFGVTFGVALGVVDDCLDGVDSSFLFPRVNFGGVARGVPMVLDLCGLGVMRLIEGEVKRKEFEDGDFERELVDEEGP